MTKQEIQGTWVSGPIFAIHPSGGVSYRELIRCYGLDPKDCLRWDERGSRGRVERDFIHLWVDESDDYKGTLVEACAAFGRPSDIPCPNDGCDWCLVDWKAGHYACPGACNELFSPEEMEPIMIALVKQKRERARRQAQDQSDAGALQAWLTEDNDG